MGRRPGAADRHLGLAKAPRPAEAVDDHDCGPGLGGSRNLGANAPGGRVGVLGEERDHAVARDVRRVDARVRADQAAVRLDDQDAVLGTEHLAALGEDQLDQPWVLSELGGELLGPSRRLDRRRGRAPAPRPSRRSSARSRRRRRLAARRRSRSSPPAARPPPPPGCPRPGGPRSKLGQGRGRGQRRPLRVVGEDARQAPRGRRACRGRARARGYRGAPRLVAGAPRAVEVALAAAGPEGGADRVAPGTRKSPFVPVPWRSVATPTVPSANADRALVELGRLEQRAVAGEERGAR